VIAVILFGGLIVWAAVAVVQATIDRHRWNTSSSYREQSYWERVQDEAALHVQAAHNVIRQREFDAHVAAVLDAYRREGRF
jgi:hypothetical protein